AKPNQVVAILKAREPARIMIAIGKKDNDSPHLEYKQRWVNQYNFYVNDQHWGRIRNARKRVHPHVSPLPVFRAGVPEPAPLAGTADDRRRYRLPTVHQRILEVRQPDAIARAGRL